MPIRPRTVSSIRQSSSITIITTTKTAAAAARARARASIRYRAASTSASASPSPPSIQHHFTRILSLWPSDSLRPAHLSFKEYIKARAALAHSSSNSNNTTIDHVPHTATATPTTTTTIPVSSSSAGTGPHGPDSTGPREQSLAAETSRRQHNGGLALGGVQVSSESHDTAAQVGGAGTGVQGAAGAGAATEAGAATTGTATATAAEVNGEVPVRSDKSAPILKDINALYTLLDDRYAKKFPLSPATLHPTSNPTHYDALLVELEEAPNRSWFGRMARKIGGLVRLK